MEAVNGRVARHANRAAELLDGVDHMEDRIAGLSQDEQLQAMASGSLQQINREGMTVVCSLHFLSLARTYATRVIALKAGRLMFDCLPSEIDEQRFRSIYGEDAVEVEIE